MNSQSQVTNDYAAGQHCTWNGPIDAAGLGRSSTGPNYFQVCPNCGGALKELTSAEWWVEVGRIDRTKPDYEAMMWWSIGRCFPDEETLVNAYRQATEE